MTEGERIQILRRKTGLTLDEFGRKIQVDKSSLSKIENGKRRLTKQQFNSICLVYGVSEEWLKNGKGEMFVESTLADELKERIDSLIPQEDEDFRLRLVRMILAMDPDDMRKLENYARKYLIGTANQKKMDIEQKVDDYRRELESEAASSKSEVSQTGRENTGRHKAI